MKNIVLILLPLLLLNCEAMEELRDIEKAKEVTIHYLDIERVHPNERSSAELISDRKVLASKVLDEEQRKTLISIVLDSSNFEQVKRRCKMEPVYAIDIDDKTRILFDIEFCPRLVFIGKNKKKETYDIKTESAFKDFTVRVFNNIKRNK